VPKSLVILGTGGNCLDILDAVQAINRHTHQFDVLGFLDDNPDTHTQPFGGHPVHGPLSLASRFEDAHFVNGIGSTRSYLAKPALTEALGIDIGRFATLVHPTAVISPGATLKSGTVILANATVCANARMGHHGLVLPNCVVSHDCHLDDYAILASGTVLCGNVTLQKSCYIGAGSVVLEGLTVGAGSLVGAGSVVTRDVPPHTIVAGNPARPR
jgi:acetyltransferase EpsM